MAYFMHQEPLLMHKMETLVNHFVELVSPILLLMPRKFCMAGGMIQMFFQVTIFCFFLNTASMKEVTVRSFV